MRKVQKTKNKFELRFPLISKLAFVLLSLPNGTASVERVIGDMNRVKSKERNRLGQENMLSLLKVRDTYKYKELGYTYPEE